MTPNDKPAFLAVMTALSETFRESVSDSRMEIYFKVLSRLTIDQVETCAAKILETSKFFPKPAEFFEVAEGSTEDRAAQAWELFIEAVRSAGSWSSVYCEDRALAAAVRHTFQGWSMACEMLGLPEDPMYASHRKTFLASYRVAQRDHDLPPGYLVGAAEANNRQQAGRFLALPPADSGKPPTYRQKIAVIASGRVENREFEFSAATGTLTEGARLALESGEHRQIGEARLMLVENVEAR